MTDYIHMPTEESEQALVFQWAALEARMYPELQLLFAIANGGKRHIKTAVMLKRTGVKAGVPDMMLPVARGGYHGLYIELKRVKNSTTSAAQKGWHIKLREQGYRVTVCKGADEAINELVSYLEGKAKAR